MIKNNSNKSTIVDKLQDLIQSKGDIKNVLVERGVEPPGNFATYVDAIDNIQTHIINGANFSVLGYDANTIEIANNLIQDDINYSIPIYNKHLDKILPNGTMEVAPDYTRLFFNDENLVYCPNIDIGYMIPGEGMFWGCSNLVYIPQLKRITFYEAKHMFDGCVSIKQLPMLDFSADHMDFMCYNCHSLTNVPLWNTINVGRMYYTFANCYNLTTIPQFDTRNAYSFENMFWCCPKLTTVPLLDTNFVDEVSGMFFECYSLTNVGGLKNLGAKKTLRTTSMFAHCNNLTHDSIMNIINNLYNRKRAGYSIVNLPLGEHNLNKISDAEKQIAINKGWSLS